MDVILEVADKKADFGAHSWLLLELLNEFYEDPENQREFEEWKAAREKERSVKRGSGD